MKKRRKLLSMLLIFAMIFTIPSIKTSATEPESLEDVQQDESGYVDVEENLSTNNEIEEENNDLENSAGSNNVSFDAEDTQNLLGEQEKENTVETSESETSIIRYTVLILDSSGSMSGTPASVQKEAAIKFCQAVTSAEGTNYVAIVRLNSSSSVRCEFTTDIDTLTSYINGIGASGGTNINQALSASINLLDTIEQDEEKTVIKNIVLCSDGLPESGSTTSDGPYTSSDYSGYRYANAAYNTAVEIKEKDVYIYTLGFFHDLSGDQLVFGQKFMTDLASDANAYREVTDVDDLEFEFGDIAEDITKEKDTDGDGLPDSWETNGVDTDGDGVIDLHLERMGADPNTPDIFVEVDWMVQPLEKFLWITTQEEISLAPSQEAMRIVYESFKEQGINLHIDAGPNSIDFVTGKTWGDLSGGNEIAYESNFELGSTYEHWNETALANFSEGRERVFRYCLFVNQYNGGTSSGIANNIPGQYFIVANQQWVRDTGDTGIAGTFMHELGHTLGLSHGGFDHEGNNNHTHYKPNYLSIMNYLFQTSGLVGDNDVDYANYTLPDLDENALSEQQGIDPNHVTAGTQLGTKLRNAGWFGLYDRTITEISGKSIDFNGWWGIEDGTVSEDLNDDGNNEILTGTSDWEHIVYEGGDVGYSGDVMHIRGIEPPDPEMQDALSEMTYEIALDKGILSNEGTGALEAIGPFTLVVGDFEQSTYVRVKNMSSEESKFTLHIDESELCEASDQVIELDASVGDLSYIDIPISINNATNEGEYSIHVYLSYENEVVSEIDVPVELHMPNKDDINILEDLINDDSGDTPDIVKEEYVKLYNQLTDNNESDNNTDNSDTESNEDEKESMVNSGNNDEGNNTKNTSTDTASQPRTGDNNYLTVFIGIMLFSGSIIVSLLYRRCKKK